MTINFVWGCKVGEFCKAYNPVDIIKLILWVSIREWVNASVGGRCTAAVIALRETDVDDRETLRIHCCWRDH